MFAAVVEADRIVADQPVVSTTGRCRLSIRSSRSPALTDGSATVLDGDRTSRGES